MKRIFTLIIICFLYLTIKAQPVGNIKQYNLHSQITGYGYELYVSLPASYKENDSSRYPVLYVLDGNFMFQVMQAHYRALHDVEQVKDLIIVGIGYSGFTYEGIKSVMQSMEKRTPDYTPTRDTAFENMLSKELNLNIGSGRADKFLRALKKEIFPLIETNYKTSERGIAGHSFGALFGAYVLFNEPSVFKKYLLSSISFPWHQQVILNQEHSFFKTNTTLDADVFTSMGAEEDSAMMIEPMRKLSASVRKHNYKNLVWEERVLSYENHPSAYLTAFNQGLRFLYKK